ncbi:hypothetical protein VE02_00297 [Pseudogymnoascus sp. 03VT05]|nr:hypothetical protein VE02_00297 [Pseudogymnoascus sp. 03VT05]
MRASVLLLAAASAVVASAETVELFGAGGAGGEFVVYPVGSDASATTYLLGCPVKSVPTTGEKCLFLEPLSYTIGPSSVQMVSTMQDLTLSQICALGGKTRAVCTVRYSGPGTSNFESYTDLTKTTMTLTGTAAEELWGPATVVHDISSIYNGVGTSTDGSSPPATTGPAATSAPTSTPTGTAGTGTTGTGTTGTFTTGTDSKAVGTSASTGGMPQITGCAGWAVGGMAAAVALAAL